jgi:hypothetical protein
MAPPFTWKHCFQFFFWVVLLLLALVVLGWFLFYAEPHKSIGLDMSQARIHVLLIQNFTSPS